MKKVLKTSRYYSSDFKEKVVLEVLNGQISSDGARKKYKIGGKMTVYRWLSAYQNSLERKNELTLSKMLEMEKEKSEGQSQVQETISDEISYLKSELVKALLKVEAYKTLLEIGKEEYGIDLEKKSGQKQSGD